MRIFIVVVAAALALTGCASTSTAEPPAAKASSPSYDGSTLDACKEADAVTNSGDNYKTSIKHAQFARSSAALSDVPALREVAQKYSGGEVGTPLDDTHAMTAAMTIATWCIQHKVAMPGG